MIWHSFAAAGFSPHRICLEIPFPPGDPERPSRQEAEGALAIPRRVHDAVLGRLPEIVHR
ncbi:MAG: hypothetical protein ABSH01_29675 [Terriglobia bacterium]|jgi:hypothetical protein